MDKRELIAEAVRELIIEKKNSAFSVEEIAKKAGIGKGTVYLYFENKQQIITFTIFYYLEKFVDSIEESVKRGENPVEKLELLIRSYMENVRGVSTFWEILFESVSTRDLKEEKDRFQKIRKRILGIIHSIIQEGVDTGFFRKFTDMEKISWIIFMLLRGMGFYVSLTKSDEEEIEEMLREVKEVLLYGIYNDSVA